MSEVSLHKIEIKEIPQMKKIMIAMLGLSLFVGATSTFAQGSTDTKPTKAKKAKKAKKTDTTATK